MALAALRSLFEWQKSVVILFNGQGVVTITSGAVRPASLEFDGVGTFTDSSNIRIRYITTSDNGVGTFSLVAGATRSVLAQYLGTGLLSILATKGASNVSSAFSGIGSFILIPTYIKDHVNSSGPIIAYQTRVHNDMIVLRSFPENTGKPNA